MSAQLEDTIRRVAEEYRARGYRVNVRPRDSELPEFLASFHPDVVATSATDNVVVEVGSSKELDGERMRLLAAVVDEQPSWRFEVALVNPHCRTGCTAVRAIGE